MTLSGLDVRTYKCYDAITKKHGQITFSTNVVLGSASLDAKMNGKIALRTMGYFVSTSFFNAILGVILVVAIHPGDPSIRGELQAEIKLDERQNTLMDNFLDLGRYRDKYDANCGIMACYLSNVSTTKHVYGNNLCLLLLEISSQVTFLRQCSNRLVSGFYDNVHSVSCLVTRNGKFLAYHIALSFI